MKGFYRLLNLEFGGWLPFLALLLPGACFLPLLLLRSALNERDALALHPRYEELYVASGCPLLFLLFFLLLCAYFLKSIYAGYWGSKSIYTFLTLPVRRESLYFGKLAAFLTAMLLLLAAQLIGMRLGYSLMATKAEAYMDGRLVMHNGLFLAFVRSDFFRLLLPLHASRILSTISLLLVTATGFYYGALCERAKLKLGFAALVPAAFVLYRVVLYRLNESNHYADPRSLLPSSLALLVFSAFYVWHGARLMKRGVIA